jgi:hypothetical protein
MRVLVLTTARADAFSGTVWPTRSRFPPDAHTPDEILDENFYPNGDASRI